MPIKTDTLLARIDERQRQVASDIEEIKESLKCTVKNDDSYKEMKERHKILWDERNKIIGYILGGGIVGGGVSTLLGNVVKVIFAR